MCLSGLNSQSANRMLCYLVDCMLVSVCLIRKPIICKLRISEPRISEAEFLVDPLSLKY